MADYCKSCGSLIIDGKCSNRKCPAENNKSKIWEIYGMKLEFVKPVTFQTARNKYNKIKNRREQIESNRKG